MRITGIKVILLTLLGAGDLSAQSSNYPAPVDVTSLSEILSYYQSSGTSGEQAALETPVKFMCRTDPDCPCPSSLGCMFHIKGPPPAIGICMNLPDCSANDLFGCKIPHPANPWTLRDVLTCFHDGSISPKDAKQCVSSCILHHEMVHALDYSVYPVDQLSTSCTEARAFEAGSKCLGKCMEQFCSPPSTDPACSAIPSLVLNSVASQIFNSCLCKKTNWAFPLSALEGVVPTQPPHYPFPDPNQPIPTESLYGPQCVGLPDCLDCFNQCVAKRPRVVPAQAWENECRGVGDIYCKQQLQSQNGALCNLLPPGP